MESAILRDKVTLFAALGAGIVVGLSGIYMYIRDRRKFKRQITSLQTTVDNLRREVVELQQLSRRTSPGLSPAVVDEFQRFRLSPITKKSTYSILSSGEDEFFDVDEFEESLKSDDENECRSESRLKLPKAIATAELEATPKEEVDPFEEIDKLLDSNDAGQYQAHKILTSMKEENMTNYKYLWRLTKSCHLCSLKAQANRDTDRMKELTLEARKYASVALALTDSDPEVHKWYAIALGSSGKFVSMQDKIKEGFEFRDHVTKAIKLKPQDPTLHHMLGRWAFEVAQLSWWERKIAATLFSEPPSATLEEAKGHFLNAEEFRPSQWKENMLFLAKTYIALGEYSTAIGWLDISYALPIKTKDDRLTHDDIESLRYTYSKHRISNGMPGEVSSSSSEDSIITGIE